MKLREALRTHWPEYLMEAWGLGAFMLSAAVFTTAVEAAGSPLRLALVSDELRRLLIGIAMGLTAIVLIYSPWGKRSGAHLNPAVTLAFASLGRVAPVDAACYVVAQLLGGLAGVGLAELVLGERFTRPPVSWVATLPGPSGLGPAFVAELGMAFALMLAVLLLNTRERLARYTGVAAGLLVATYITLAAPISGMSINPARSLASAVPAGVWQHQWIYWSAPPLGMLAAAAVFGTFGGLRRRGCAKLRHTADMRCIHCGHEPAVAMRVTRGSVAGEAAS